MPRCALPQRQPSRVQYSFSDGLFLHCDVLADLWDVSIWLHVPVEVRLARMARRDGSHPDPTHPSVARYVGGRALYLASCDPASRADVVIDNSEPDRPNWLS